MVGKPSCYTEMKKRGIRQSFKEFILARSVEQSAAKYNNQEICSEVLIYSHFQKDSRKGWGLR